MTGPEPGRDTLGTAFRQALAERVLLADGGVGTLLYQRVGGPRGNLDALNLTQPRVVEQVHLDYIRAGADLIETNTFGANAFRLAEYGLEDDVWRINLQGAKLARGAREVSGRPVFVAGSVGPVGRPLETLGRAARAYVRDAFLRQMEALLAGGVDLFMIETMLDVEELELAVEAARSLARLPVVAQITFSGGVEPVAPLQGEAFTRMVERLGEAGPDVAGINCGSGPGPVLEALGELAGLRALGVPLSALPNAGLPTRVDGRILYGAAPEYLAGLVEPMLRQGVRLVGGCCGTTPEHIAAMRARLDTLQPARAAGPADEGEHAHPARVAPAEVRSPKTEAAVPAAPAASPLLEALRRGEMVSVELDPPRGVNVEKVLQNARILQEAGVTCINVADSPMARVRMASLASARLILEATGLPPLIHFTTRDRNLMGIQADLLGAHALGIRHVLALTGDPPSVGNYSHASAVYDVDSIGLVRILHTLNRGRDLAGNAIGEPTAFTVAVALSPNAADPDLEARRFREKLEAGADFVMTQPLYEIEPLVAMLERAGGCPVPLVLGVMPLQSHKHAEYLHNEVPGIRIPLRVREEMARAGEDGARVGMELAARVLEDARGFIQGCYVVPSFGRVEQVAGLVRELRRRGGWATPAPAVSR
ncbi:bifunctional homocysteine S-methyltransferase/methylenetetrahydrofolate reductase [Limnochorda pilosa]|uniref:Homocysteine S-methyltransferase n=1 Tax=Limnochorda pilosa TaxID=1555112 RepID=A0A0K2SML9_LIMPI|nr:bifunctional homocysteine S-methyltransferase/methylenetetrahydrofolate reductase [Limnochorda pilosa]BAS28361.1 homocysteine S-methyltransferase [Limnochorda pilosa]